MYPANVARSVGGDSPVNECNTNRISDGSDAADGLGVSIRSLRCDDGRDVPGMAQA